MNSFYSVVEAQLKRSCYQKEVNISADKIFEKMEVKPSFKGGEDSLQQFILTKLNTDKIANSINKNIRFFIDTLKIKFIISRDGNMSNLIIQNSKNLILKKEMENALILSSCNWLPGSSNRNLTGWYSKYFLFSLDRRGNFLSIKLELQDNDK